MAVLSDQARARIAAAFQREMVGEPFGFTKTQLRNAVNNADDWVEANAAAFIAALPAGFRTASSAAQKIALLSLVLERRAGRLRVTEDD